MKILKYFSLAMILSGVIIGAMGGAFGTMALSGLFALPWLLIAFGIMGFMWYRLRKLEKMFIGSMRHWGQNGLLRRHMESNRTYHDKRISEDRAYLQKRITKLEKRGKVEHKGRKSKKNTAH